MKKKLLIYALLLTIFPNVKAQYNLFDAADVDADGWIWFNTQAKIDKYIGSGKVIELQDASFEPFNETKVSPDILGVGTDKLLGSATAIRGSIVLPSASNIVTGLNGGGLMVYMPSCTLFSVSLSSESSMRPALKGGSGRLILQDVANIKSFPFTSLSGAGQKKWEGLQTYVNISNFKLESSTPVTAFVLNGNTDTLYVHGLKVLTSTPTSISNPTVEVFNPRYYNKKLILNQIAQVKLYSLGGKLVAKETNSEISLASLAKGVYIVRIKNEEGDGCTKIMVY